MDNRQPLLGLGLVLLGGLAGALGAQPQTVLDESFCEAPAIPAVPGFTAYGGQWRVEDGVLWAGGGPGPKLICDQPPLSCGEVGVEVRLADRRNGNAGLIVKVSQPGEGADHFTGYEVSLDAAGQVLRLGRHRQNFEQIRDVPCDVPVNQWLALTVRMTERTLEIRVGERCVLKYEDTQHPLAAGSIGLRPWIREAQFRNLWIRSGDQTKNVPFAVAPADNQQQRISGRWQAICRGTARAAFALVPPSASDPRQLQQIRFVEGQGEVGLAHRGTPAAGGVAPPGWGWVAGRPYEGVVQVRCEHPVPLVLAAETADGQVLGEAVLNVSPGEWRQLPFTLTPTRASEGGLAVVKLRSPGSVVLGRVAIEPGDWAWPGTLAVSSLPPIAVVTRHPFSAPPAAGQDIWAAQPRAPGCSIRIVDPSRPDRPARTIFADPGGSIYDMNVSYDARTLFFSYRRKDERYWHIWRVSVDGSGLKQLTDGPHYDVSPCLLPDGELLFVSTRRFGYTLCQPGPASNLHRMAADGSNIRCVSMNTLSDFSPQILPDGRVLFTRWEYIDRDLTYRQSLWTQNPDGTAYQLYFGNVVREVGTFWQARPLPGGSDRVVATFAPHHGFPHGAIGLIDRARGPEGPRGQSYTWITAEFSEIGDRAHEWSYRDPFPLDDHTLLCSYGGGGVHRYRIFILDTEDRKRLVYEDPEQGCYFPLALRPVPVPPQLAPRLPSPSPATSAAEESPSGTFLLADVYRGLEPTIARGRVQSLRVMEQIRKTEDLASRAYDQSPVMSYGTYYAKRCWGTVPVEADGSAHFRAPALREIYFQVLDAEGRELQRMTSGVQLMPGERISCIGCHEPREAAPSPVGQLPLAARKPPADLQRPAWGTDGIVDFPTIVQPVLDKYCVKCHAGTCPDGGCDLSGDKTRYFNMAYDNLLGRSRSYRQHDMASGEMLPEEKAKGKPMVHFYWLLRTPTGVNQPLWTGCYASRLLDYIDTDHGGQRLPLEARQRIYLWIDANVPYYGTYAHSRPKSPGKRDRWTDAETGQLSSWFAADFLGVYNRRCASCHGKYEGTIDWEGRYAWINLSNPRFSPALTAHLAKQAGGRGIDKPLNGHTPPLFPSTADPDYQAMLRAIEAGKQHALATAEADMPGFLGARKEP